MPASAADNARIETALVFELLTSWASWVMTAPAKIKKTMSRARTLNNAMPRSLRGALRVAAASLVIVELSSDPHFGSECILARRVAPRGRVLCRLGVERMRNGDADLQQSLVSAAGPGIQHAES